MITISEAEISDNIQALWSATTNGPVTVLRAGKAVAVVLSPAEFARLTARRRGIKAGFGKHLFPGVDMNALLETNIDDVFEDYRAS